MWLTNSSVGRKVVMSVTGLFLILFVTFHVLMNAVAIFWPGAYNTICEFLGANWYTLIGTLVLAAGFVIHIIYAIWLTLQNRKARGSDRYAVSSRPKSVEWASQNMLVLGIIVICFILIHLTQFWAKMQLQEVLGEHVAPGMCYVYEAFKCPWTLPIYLIGFIALWFHMTHGFWSAFQTLGANNTLWLKRLKDTACVWATVVCLLFAVEAIAFTIQANCPKCQAGQCPLQGKPGDKGQPGKPECCQPGQQPCPDCEKAQGPECCHKRGNLSKAHRKDSPATRNRVDHKAINKVDLKEDLKVISRVDLKEDLKDKAAPTVSCLPREHRDKPPKEPRNPHNLNLRTKPGNLKTI